MVEWEYDEGVIETFLQRCEDDGSELDEKILRTVSSTKRKSPHEMADEMRRGTQDGRAFYATVCKMEKIISEEEKNRIHWSHQIPALGLVIDGVAFSSGKPSYLRRSIDKSGPSFLWTAYQLGSWFGATAAAYSALS